MKTGFCSLLFLVHVFFLSAQSWEEQAVIPAPGRDDGVAFAAGGFGYLVTGNQGGFSQSNRLWKYDPSLNSWSEAASFPGTPRQYAASFVFGSDVYLFCGISEGSVPLHDVWNYNTDTDTWTQLSDFPGAARWSLFCGEMNGFGYMGTGTTLTELLSDTWKYDPLSDTWTQLADFPGGVRREAVSFSLDGKIYAGLGWNMMNGTGVQQDFYAFTPVTNSWEQIADFPGGARSYAVAASSGNLGYAGTGYDAASVFRSDVYSYDPQAASWNLAEAVPAEGIRGMSAFTIGGEPYFLTGLTNELERSSRIWKLRTVEEIVPEVFCYPNPSSGSVAVRSLPDSEIRLYTLQGKVVRKLHSSSIYTTIENLRPGSYIIEVEKSGSAVCEMLIVN